MTNTDLMNVQAFDAVVPNEAFAGLNPEQENLADGIGSSYGIVGYRGKVWTLRLRGETYTFTRPDDGSPAAFLDCIVLRAPGWKSKSYYPPGSFEQGNTGERPICASLDGVTPDSDVKERQAQACAICPRNEWKTDANGRKGRDCSDYKRLAVLLLPNATKTLLGAPLMEPVFLRVPAASLNDLAILGEAMSKKGFHFSTYITRVGFQTDKAHPQMTFRALQPLTAKEAPIVLQLREDAVAYRITGENEVGKQQPYVPSGNALGQSGSPKTGPASTAGAAPTTTAQTATKQPEQQTTTSPSKPVVETKPIEVKPAEDDEEAALMAQLAAARAKKKAAAEAAAKQEVIPPAEKPKSQVNTDTGLGEAQSVVEAGFGDLDQPTPQKQEAAPTTNTVEDTGMVDDADADLDARVAGLLKS